MMMIEIVVSYKGVPWQDLGIVGSEVHMLSGSRSR